MYCLYNYFDLMKIVLRFDWLLTNNKKAALAKIIRFDWLSFPFELAREKIRFNFSQDQTDKYSFTVKK